MKKIIQLATTFLLSSCAIISPDKGNQNNADLAEARHTYTHCLMRETGYVMREIEKPSEVMDFVINKCEQHARMVDFHNSKVLADYRATLENDTREPGHYILFLDADAKKLRRDGRLTIGRYLSKYRDVDYGISSLNEAIRKKAKASGQLAND